MSEYLQWAFIVISLTLIFVVFAINPLQAAIDEAIKNHAQLQAQRLASIINIAASAPDRTTYTFEMPRLKCKITITGHFVKMIITPITGAEISHEVSIIKTPTIITAKEFDCKEHGTLILTKTGNKLDIFSG